VRYTQISLGHRDPHISRIARLENVIKGTKRSSGLGRRGRLLITLGILECLKGMWLSSPDTRDTALLWAVSCLCFLGFISVGEAVVPNDSEFDAAIHLAYGNVRVDNCVHPSYLEVYLKASKTDPFQQGVSIYLRQTDNWLRPVAAILDYTV